MDAYDKVVEKLVRNRKSLTDRTFKDRVMGLLTMVWRDAAADERRRSLDAIRAHFGEIVAGRAVTVDDLDDA